MFDVKAAYDKRQAPGDLDGVAGHELPELDRQLSDLHNHQRTDFVTLHSASFGSSSVGKGVRPCVRACDYSEYILYW